jgi:hypothetical protein
MTGVILYFYELHRLKADLEAKPGVDLKAKADRVSQSNIRLLAELIKHIQPAMNNFDRKGILLFADMLVDLARFRVRVVQVVDFAGRALRQEVTVEFRIPPSAQQASCLYLPVLMPIKGEIVDNLRLYDPSGKSLVTLTYEETACLAAAGLTYLLATCEPAEDGNSVSIDDQLLMFLELIVRRGVMNQKYAYGQIKDRLNALGPKVPPETRKRLGAYLSLLSVTYPIVVVVPSTAITGERLLGELVTTQRNLPGSPDVGARGGSRGCFRLRADDP